MIVKKHGGIEYIECPKCGYNNERKRFQFFGTCLRCNHIMDGKIYLKRLLYITKRRKERDEQKKRNRIY